MNRLQRMWARAMPQGFPERPRGISDDEWSAFVRHVRDGETQRAVAAALGVGVDRVSAMLSRVHVRATPQVDDRRCPCCNGTGLNRSV